MIASEKSRFDALYDQHLTALKLQGKAQKTIDSYARALRRVAHFVDRCPDDLTKADLTAYFSQLVDTRSWSTVKIDRCGLMFFYEHVLEQAFPWIDLVRPPRIKSLPDVLTPSEIAAIVLATREPGYRSFWLATYSMGLRLSETLHLQVGDIDAGRRQVHIRRGKGHKDRFVYLPDLTLRMLRRYWASHRHPRFLFPGKTDLDGGPALRVMDRGSTQKALGRVVADCRIEKKVSIHSLRHAYATHLIEAGLNLRAIQHLLGHACPKTTARYVHLSEKSLGDSHRMIEGLINQLTAAARSQKAQARHV